MPESMTLYTIAMSHFSEKIRWLLDIEGMPYREVALTPVFHVWPALRMGRRGRTTVPVLRRGRQAVQDSTRIIEWLSTEPAGLKTLPAELRQEIMALEDTFDGIGDAVVRYLYQKGFAYPEFIMSLWTRFATPAQTRFIRMTYGPTKQIFKIKLWINQASAKRAESEIDAMLTMIEGRLAGGKRYLVGDRLTVADLTAAALLAPLACPTEHKVYGDPAFRSKMMADAEHFQNRPALAWVRQMYALHRGPFWRVLPTAA